MLLALRANGWPKKPIEEIETLCATPKGRNEFASRAARAALGRGVTLLIAVVVAGYLFLKVLKLVGV